MQTQNKQEIGEIWTRRSFDVRAVQVTEENAGRVAAWCGGSAGKSLGERNFGKVYVGVDVVRFERLRQDKAWVGDWIVYNGDTYMVYREKAFLLTFQKKQALDILELRGKIQEIVKKAMQTQDVATYFERSSETIGADAKFAEEIFELIGLKI
ncbi:hypothetical protein SEA_CRICKO_84 [Streptomyces phage CricKo]|nr:hypothetical protein SEA_RAINYDAI_81 [Streptomyces phage Rainydai]QJD49967.1 hypothetical protein SEA_CRICKO_84 [Streptomyces phage CricKo]QNL30699.1 hypothetical protein SEA_THIQQUMS_84 [Streptomyces phage Thiqqums]